MGGGEALGLILGDDGAGGRPESAGPGGAFRARGGRAAELGGAVAVVLRVAGGRNRSARHGGSETSPHGGCFVAAVILVLGFGLMEAYIYQLDSKI